MDQIPVLLIVEDNEADRMLFEECAKHHSRPARLFFAVDGCDAMELLQPGGGTRPHLILLDLNLPKKDGREVLTEIKGDPLLKDIPVIVMSTSAEKTDIVRCYALGAMDYLTKPNSLEQYDKLVARLIDQCYELPTVSHGEPGGDS